MADKFAAAVMVGERQTEVREFEMPEIGPNEGVLRIEACGVCGSDWPGYLRARPGTEPHILGHETVGFMARVGAEASKRWGVKEGDRVAVEEFIPCGHCRACRSGHYQVCEATDPMSARANGEVALRYGSTPLSVPPHVWGGYSQFMYLHPNSIIYKVPAHVSAEEAPLFIPISNGIRWVNQDGEAGVGSTVVILGPGQHGLGCVIGAKEAGAYRIIVSGLSRDADRLELAKELGATHTIVADKEDLFDRVKEITDGEMADVTIDITSGSATAINDALRVAGKRGRVIVAGGVRGSVPDFSTSEIHRKELTIRGVRGHDFRSVLPAIELIASGRYPLAKLCTHRYGLEDVDFALRTAAGETEEKPIHISIVPDLD